jgi:hypothetical protein
MTKPTFENARSRGKINKVGQLNPLQRYAIPDEVTIIDLGLNLYILIVLKSFYLNRLQVSSCF